MEERGVDEYVVAGNVMALRKDRLAELQEEQAEAIVIETKVSGGDWLKGNRIMVVTVIDKAKVFVKKGTVIERLCPGRRACSAEIRPDHERK